MEVLKTLNLTKTYKKISVVNNVNMVINQGDIYGFVGENGAGKTTLIRLVTNSITKTKGEAILFAGKPINKGCIGAIVEKPSFYEYLNAYNNLKYHFLVLGLNDYERIPSLLKMVGLDSEVFSTKKVANFSLGMRQRLAIAITLISNPQLLFLDEPMNGLDPEGIIQMRELILKLNKEHGITFLISSHILSELAKVANRFGFISKGVLIKEVSIEDINHTLKAHYKLKLAKTTNIESFLKSENISDYKIQNGDVLIYDNINIESFILKLIKEEFGLIDITRISESLEDYYIKTLYGGLK